MKRHIIKRRGREGAAAVEFALVSLPFFVLILAILEIAVVLTVSALLETATLNSGRLVRTGQVSQTMTQAEFKAEICERMLVFRSQCMGRLFLDVRPVNTFSNPLVPDPIGKNGQGKTVFDEEQTAFQPGQPRDLMVVRVWYRQPTMTPFLNQAMSRVSGDTLLHATSAFRNEPY
ncbi:TadE/TadG family type IV pilus assembly protein [Brevundimonas sp.]|uniref:TadE/TadG family type IV pilus assembly protein n=1 Tax=Brevundimonas sp. TaxID=1871086 RepID=UPI00289ACDB6|nr:TadE/TadG family type IV pilus assembly protein [Brevundimonas sp.]